MLKTKESADIFVVGIHFVTMLKKNTKNSLMNLYDKILQRKRAFIENVNNELKNRACRIQPACKETVTQN